MIIIFVLFTNIIMNTIYEYYYEYYIIFQKYLFIF